ncbi:phosphotransferase [Pseudoalteromonas sp. JB197]|uniref:phosphotransferase n=1 Tax=Pseudoalteromonas sp. JB197 TaxID=1434839 RepID=UPI00097F40F7|nr:phosphotransferase [Pseudoalteromonas sp. JB197]PCC13565.1 choline kinase [Pseudoalteromonas sp. JB197]SJN46881.1 Putative choline kinase, PnuC-associated, THI-regulated [Pseudoalteromonas sp. JB197]
MTVNNHFNKSQLVKICSAFIEPKSIVTYEQLLNGLSNDNFLIRTQQQAYLLKRYKDHWPSNALVAQHVFSNYNVCPAPIWLDETNKYAAFDYIEGETASFISSSLVNKLAVVHNYSATTEAMNIAQELLFYQQSEIYKQYQPHIEIALNTVANMPLNAGFCHNDLVRENIIVNTADMYLIDFEYAKSNDVYFDLAALAVSFKLNEKQQTELLYNYQKQYDKNQKPEGEQFYFSISKLNCYKLFFLMLSLGWYEQRAINSKEAELRAQLNELIVSDY